MKLPTISGIGKGMRWADHWSRWAISGSTQKDIEVYHGDAAFINSHLKAMKKHHHNKTYFKEHGKDLKVKKNKKGKCTTPRGFDALLKLEADVERIQKELPTFIVPVKKEGDKNNTQGSHEDAVPMVA